MSYYSKMITEAFQVIMKYVVPGQDDIVIQNVCKKLSFVSNDSDDKIIIDKLLSCICIWVFFLHVKIVSVQQICIDFSKALQRTFPCIFAYKIITRIYMQAVNIIVFFLNINYSVILFCFVFALFFFEHHVNRHNH